MGVDPLHLDDLSFESNCFGYIEFGGKRMVCRQRHRRLEKYDYARHNTNQFAAHWSSPRCTYLSIKNYSESLTVTVSSCFRSSPGTKAYPKTVRTYVPGSARYYPSDDIVASRWSRAPCTCRDRRVSPHTECESSRSTGIARSPSICCCDNCRHDPASCRRSYPSLRRRERRPPNAHWTGPSRNREDRARDPSCE